MILVVTSDKVIGGCIIRALNKNGFDGHLSNNAIEAINYVGEVVPEMVFLDILLTGPDGFTFLNEMASYADTFEIPVVLLGEKDFSKFDFSAYSVVGFLDKNTMLPDDIKKYASLYARKEND